MWASQEILDLNTYLIKGPERYTLLMASVLNLLSQILRVIFRLIGVKHKALRLHNDNNNDKNKSIGEIGIIGVAINPETVIIVIIVIIVIMIMSGRLNNNNNNNLLPMEIINLDKNRANEVVIVSIIIGIIVTVVKRADIEIIIIAKVEDLEIPPQIGMTKSSLRL